MIPVGLKFGVLEETEFRDPKTKQTIANYLPGHSYRVTALNQQFVDGLMLEKKAFIDVDKPSVQSSPGGSAAGSVTL